MFSKFELTNDGVNLLNRVIAEKKTLKFTKFQLGKGDYEGDKKELSRLVDKFDEFNITQTNVLTDGITNIRGFYDNRNLSIASKLTEIGIMAQLGDDSLTEILFSYSNQPSADAETVPAKESYFSRTFSVMNKTDNVTSVTFDLTIRQDKYNFGTLEEMKSADYLDVGDKVTLWGETELGDTPFRMYLITDEVQDIQLINTLHAKEYFAVTNDLQNVNKNSVLNAEIVKKLAESNQGLKFDTILNIDDVGTKQEGYCYMFEGDIYKCIKQTEVTTPESANFQPISNNKLSDRLDNLRNLNCDVKKYDSTYITLEIIEADTFYYWQVRDKIGAGSIPASHSESITFETPLKLPNGITVFRTSPITGVVGTTQACEVRSDKFSYINKRDSEISPSIFGGGIIPKSIFN